MRFIDLIGKKFDRLTVVWPDGRVNREILWFCICDCGNMSHVRGQALRERKIKSCGCLSRELIKAKTTKHGCTGTPEYRCYKSARSRCNNPHSKDYKNYGGRGIKFLFNSFETFYAALGQRPSLIYTLDRPNNDGHYEKGNVRWATRLEQNHNRRTPAPQKRNAVDGRFSR